MVMVLLVEYRGHVHPRQEPGWQLVRTSSFLNDEIYQGLNLLQPYQFFSLVAWPTVLYLVTL